MELQAASLLLSVNIAVYQAGQPRWAVTNFPPGQRPNVSHWQCGSTPYIHSHFYSYTTHHCVIIVTTGQVDVICRPGWCCILLCCWLQPAHGPYRFLLQVHGSCTCPTTTVSTTTASAGPTTTAAGDLQLPLMRVPWQQWRMRARFVPSTNTAAFWGQYVMVW